MTLSSRHRIRNSNPGGLRPSTLPLGHGGTPQYWLSHVDGEETFFVSYKPPRPGTEPRTLAWKAAVLTTTLGPPPSVFSRPLTQILSTWLVDMTISCLRSVLTDLEEYRLDFSDQITGLKACICHFTEYIHTFIFNEYIFSGVVVYFIGRCLYLLTL